jgi:biotin carboxyl carrier protein
MDLNEGIRLLKGKPKIVLPLKKKEEPAKPAAAPATAAAPTPAPRLYPAGPVTTTCQVVENGQTRDFKVTIELPKDLALADAGPMPTATAAAPSRGNGGGTQVFSPFDGKAEVVEIKVGVGDSVSKGQVVAAVEAMKAKHDVGAPCAGKIVSIDVGLGDDVMAGKPIMTIGG